MFGDFLTSHISTLMLLAGLFGSPVGPSAADQRNEQQVQLQMLRLGARDNHFMLKVKVVEVSESAALFLSLQPRIASLFTMQALAGKPASRDHRNWSWQTEEKRISLTMQTLEKLGHVHTLADANMVVNGGPHFMFPQRFQVGSEVPVAVQKEPGKMEAGLEFVGVQLDLSSDINDKQRFCLWVDGKLQTVSCYLGSVISPPPPCLLKHEIKCSAEMDLGQTLVVCTPFPGRGGYAWLESGPFNAAGFSSPHVIILVTPELLQRMPPK